jgi:hypothetical protein
MSQRSDDKAVVVGVAADATSCPHKGSSNIRYSCTASQASDRTVARDSHYRRLGEIWFLHDLAPCEDLRSPLSPYTCTLSVLGEAATQLSSSLSSFGAASPPLPVVGGGGLGALCLLKCWCLGMTDGFPRPIETRPSPPNGTRFHHRQVARRP